MPHRVYFHLVNHAERVFDPVGVEIDSLEEAKSEALKAIQEACDEERDLEWDGWVLEAADAAGTVIFRIPLSGKHH